MMQIDTLTSAEVLLREDRARGIAALQTLFRAGIPPQPELHGRYRGKLLVLDIAPGMTGLAELLVRAWMPWRGKIFDSARARGANIFTRDSFALANVYWPLYRGYVGDGPDTYQAFQFRTWHGRGLFDADRQVLKIDYDLPPNPRRTIRRVLDELVQLSEGSYLGKAHLHWWWGSWQTVAYFTLAPGS
jgi:hypothetical protein